jgi:hypothetical protein
VVVAISTPKRSPIAVTRSSAPSEIAAELEEVVVEPDLVETQDVTEQCGEIGRVPEGLAVRRKGRRWWERAAVDLPARAVGQLVEHDHDRGHHRRRHDAGDVAPHLRRRGRGHTARGHVGHEPVAVVVDRHRDDGGFAHVIERHESAFDFAGRHHGAAHLDARVEPPHRHQQPVGPQHREVARARAATAVGRREEHFGGELGIVPVPERGRLLHRDDPARHAGWHRLIVVVDELHVDVGGDSPRGERAVVGVLAGPDLVQRDPSALRAAEHVLDDDVGAEQPPGEIHVGAVDRFAAEADPADGGDRIAVAHGVAEGAEDRG